MKQIEQYPNYAVDENGNVFSVKTGKPIKQFDCGTGYFRVGLSRNGKEKHFLVHRLVAEAFIPNPERLPLVNHKDENKKNNCVSNLEWCTYEYNANYGTAIERRKRTRNQYESQAEPDKEIPRDLFVSDKSKMSLVKNILSQITDLPDGTQAYIAGYIAGTKDAEQFAR